MSAILFIRSASELSAIEAGKLAVALAQFCDTSGFDWLGSLRETVSLNQLSFNVNPAFPLPRQ